MRRRSRHIERLCVQCGVRYPKSGALPLGAEVHLLPEGKFVITCSPRCRKAAGLRSRRSRS